MIEYIFWSVAIFFATLVYYIFIMQLIKVVKGTKWQPVGYLFLMPFLLLDALMNIMILTVWFMELPKQWLVTSRLKLWRKEYENENYNSLSFFEQRRLIFAVNICDKLLDKYDTLTGDHC